LAPLSLLVAGLASAQLPQFDLDSLVVDSSAAGSLVVGTGEILPTGAVRFSLAGDYQNNPYRYIDPTGTVTSIISDRYTVHVVGGFAPVEWLEVGLDLPIVASQNPGEGIEVVLPGLAEPVRRALGSPTLSARGGLFYQSKGSPLDVAFQLGAKIPIGNGLAFVSDGKVGLSPKLMIGRNLDWARAGIELGVHWRPTAEAASETGDPAIDDIGTRLLIAGALSGGPKDGLRGELSGRTYITTTGKVGAVELLLGARYPIAPNMEVYALAGPGLGQAPGTPQWRVMIGAAFGNGAGITGTPMPGEAAPGGVAAPSTTGPSTTTPTTTPPEQQPAPSNPYPPFTPPPQSYPPQTYPPPESYPQPQPQYPPQPTYPPGDGSTAPAPQPAPTYSPPPPQPAPPPPPPPEPGYNTYPSGG